MPEVIHEKTLGTRLFDAELVSHVVSEMIASARTRHGLTGLCGITLDAPTYQRMRNEYSERYGSEVAADHFDILTCNGKCRVTREA